MLSRALSCQAAAERCPRLLPQAEGGREGLQRQQVLQKRQDLLQRLLRWQAPGRGGHAHGPRRGGGAQGGCAALQVRQLPLRVLHCPAMLCLRRSIVSGVQSGWRLPLLQTDQRPARCG